MEVEKTSFQIIKFYIKFYINKINQSESVALSHYKSSGYTDINYYLINNKFRVDDYFYYESFSLAFFTLKLIPAARLSYFGNDTIASR